VCLPRSARGPEPGTRPHAIERRKQPGGSLPLPARPRPLHRGSRPAPRHPGSLPGHGAGADRVPVRTPRQAGPVDSAGRGGPALQPLALARPRPVRAHAGPGDRRGPGVHPSPARGGGDRGPVLLAAGGRGVARAAGGPEETGLLQLLDAEGGLPQGDRRWARRAPGRVRRVAGAGKARPTAERGRPAAGGVPLVAVRAGAARGVGGGPRRRRRSLSGPLRELVRRCLERGRRRRATVIVEQGEER
jgi:hypothetical protein